VLHSVAFVSWGIFIEALLCLLLCAPAGRVNVSSVWKIRGLKWKMNINICVYIIALIVFSTWLSTTEHCRTGGLIGPFAATVSALLRVISRWKEVLMTPPFNVGFVSGFVDPMGGFLIKGDTLCIWNDENLWLGPRSNCVTAHQLIRPWILAPPVAEYTGGETTCCAASVQWMWCFNGTCRNRRRCPYASLITIP
jgi:hypothetical protein